MHLVLLIGPPAVGKMTVGQQIAERTTYRLFHNHQSIDPLLSVFDYGTPAFARLSEMLRREVIAEAMAASLPGLIFTVVVDLDDEDDIRAVRGGVDPVLAAGGRVDVVELTADLQTRLSREGSQNRTLHKSSKRDVQWAMENTRAMERAHVMATADLADGAPPWPWPHFVVDTTALDPAQAAEYIVHSLNLPRA